MRRRWPSSVSITESPPPIRSSGLQARQGPRWAEVLARLEHDLYYVVIVPLVAFLPASLAYRLACLRGDLHYKRDTATRREIEHNLEIVLGDQLHPAERDVVVRDFFRLQSCKPLDLMRLAGDGRALLRLVEIQGLEHIEAALAAGKGAIIGGAHFGSYVTGFSMLGALGLPVTVIARPLEETRPGRSRLRWLIADSTFYALRMRHRRGPDIQPREGEFSVALQAAEVLRRNELVETMLDPQVLRGDQARAVQVQFLGGQATLLPGAATLAQLTGAPLMVMLLRRSADWYHQILEISPPIPVDADPAVTFTSCLAVIDAAIRRDPAHWDQWRSSTLEQLGLLPIGQ